MLLFTSCAEEFISQQGTPIRVEASCEIMSTRSDLDIQGNAFYAGETIKAYITDSDDGVIGNPTLYTTAEPENGVNELIPNVQPYYPNKDVTVDVVAVYPPVGVVVEDENEVDIDITKEMAIGLYSAILTFFPSGIHHCLEYK